MKGLGEGGGGEAGADHELGVGRAAGVLGEWDVEGGLGGDGGRAVTDVGDDADDSRVAGGRVVVAGDDLLTDGVLAGEVLTGKGLIDDEYFGGAETVFRRERAPAQQGNLKSGKEGWGDGANLRVGQAVHLCGELLFAADGEENVRASEAHGRAGNGRR